MKSYKISVNTKGVDSNYIVECEIKNEQPVISKVTFKGLFNVSLDVTDTFNGRLDFYEKVTAQTLIAHNEYLTVQLVKELTR